MQALVPAKAPSAHDHCGQSMRSNSCRRSYQQRSPLHIGIVDNQCDRTHAGARTSKGPHLHMSIVRWTTNAIKRIQALVPAKASFAHEHRAVDNQCDRAWTGVAIDSWLRALSTHAGVAIDPWFCDHSIHAGVAIESWLRAHSIHASDAIDSWLCAHSIHAGGALNSMFFEASFAQAKRQP